LVPHNALHDARAIKEYFAARHVWYHTDGAQGHIR
jgi:hypothetical protein